jgi:N-methylhydantoinase A
MPLEGTDAAWAEARYEEMRREIAAILPGTGAPVMHRAVDLRYLGQEHTVTIALESLTDWTQLRARFDAAHERAYGYAAREVDVQLLNLRLAVVFPLEPPRLATAEPRSSGAPAFETRKIYSTLSGDSIEYRVYQRAALRSGDQLQGPAAIEEPGTTTIIDSADTLSIENHGCLVIHVNAAGAMGGIGGSEHRSPR